MIASALEGIKSAGSSEGKPMIETIDAPARPIAYAGPLRVDDFVAWLVRRDCAPGTIQAYSWGVKDFQGFLHSQGLISLHQVTRSHLENWQDRLAAVGMRPRSRSLAVTAIRAYLGWASDHELCDARLVGWLTTVKVDALQPKPLSRADLAAMIDHYTPRPEPGRQQLTYLRDRALFFVLLSTGARVSEGLAMPRAGFERCSVRQKGGGQKLLTIPEGVASVVREYLAARVDASPLLFAGIGPAGVRQIWHRACERIGIAPFTTHSLRHTYATELLAKGIDSRIVAELLGHKNMQTIMVYTKMLESSRKQAEDTIAAVLALPFESKPEPDAPPDPRSMPRTTGQRGRPRFLAGAQ
jgi:integrase/recombinase XerD